MKQTTEQFETAPVLSGAASQAIVRAADGKTWVAFRKLRGTLTARQPGDVIPALAAVEEATSKGCYAVGFLCYEAAGAFDTALKTRPAGTMPLLWFGLYNHIEPLRRLPRPRAHTLPSLPWTPSVSRAAYTGALERIKHYIAAGDTYQVNYTMRLSAAFRDDPANLFTAMLANQDAPLAAYIDTGRHVVCSASPELFFELDSAAIATRPMKGTASRGLTPAQDEEHARWLEHSAKNRAENVMIVDMLRNDLGRIARTGTVRVPSLFDVEKYDTLFQMTSTIEARTDAPLADLFRALFPCASVTGAPKVRAMELIDALESTPRGLYTGCIGYVLPRRKARFGVAIRTAVVDRATQTVEFGTGSGIVWDSSPAAEYEECLTKALVLSERSAPFELLETMLWTPQDGYLLLDRHLKRMASSARYFDFDMNTDALVAQLDGKAAGLERVPHRVRVLADRQGGFAIEAVALPREEPTPVWHVALAREPVRSTDRFLYHKTTRRDVYDNARAAWADCDDVLLWNEDGELTEFTFGNLVACLADGRRVTPPVHCGVLAGTFREQLLEEGAIQESVLTLSDLARTRELYLINSVRGWVRTEWVMPDTHLGPAHHTSSPLHEG